MLSGEFSVTLDGTGRIALPRRLRDILEKDKVVLTKGADSCLWLYSAAEWDEQEQLIVSTTNRYSARDRIIWQHFIGPKQELEIDKQGRILIPPTLRDHAGLSKDCIILGQRDYVEIWAEDRYREHLEAGKEDFKAGLEELGNRIMTERNFGSAGNNAHSGSAG